MTLFLSASTKPARIPHDMYEAGHPQVTNRLIYRLVWATGAATASSAVGNEATTTSATSSSTENGDNDPLSSGYEQVYRARLRHRVWGDRSHKTLAKLRLAGHSAGPPVVTSWDLTTSQRRKCTGGGSLLPGKIPRYPPVNRRLSHVFPLQSACETTDQHVQLPRKDHSRQ
ncbi:hypothetical protein C8J57DRAFT_1565913 [Mycena rebaudengoi]|nr:hypothetical protein C8J57DRAFT_1565913 [Mycena rebaudengoi]